MNWEEIVQKQMLDYKEYLTGYKKTLDQLEVDKNNLLQHLKVGKVADLPEQMRTMLNNNREGWDNEWGMYGNRFKAMRIAHQKEINKFFRAQDLTNDLSKKERGKDKDQER